MMFRKALKPLLLLSLLIFLLYQFFKPSDYEIVRAVERKPTANKITPKEKKIETQVKEFLGLKKPIGEIKIDKQAQVREALDLIARDDICTLNKKAAQYSLEVRLEVLGQLQGELNSGFLSSSAQRELFSLESPLVGKSGSYQSKEARYFETLHRANLINGQIEVLDADQNRVLNNLTELSEDDSANTIPALFRAHLMKEMNYSRDEVKQAFIEGMRKPKADQYSQRVRMALTEKGLYNASAFLLSHQTTSFVPQDNLAKIYEWISEQMSQDSDFLKYGRRLGYTLVYENWMTSEPWDAIRKSQMGYTIGRNLVKTFIETYYEGSTAPRMNLPTWSENYKKKTEALKGSRPIPWQDLNHVTGCKREKVDAFFEEQKKRYLGYLGQENR